MMHSSSPVPLQHDGVTKSLQLGTNVPVQAFFKQMHGVLGIYLTNKCNLQCSHCCVSSGPRESTHLTIDAILPQLSPLVHAGVVKGVHVSGGEPFLYQNDLRRICTAGHELGIPVAVNTNAFWARHIEAAENVIGSLPGITQLIMSADTYHESFLPLSRVVTAVNVALKRGILVHLCICTPKGQRNEFVERLETALGTEVIDQIEISINPVELGGRADILPEAHWRGVESTWPEGRCWLINRPVILEDGSVLACCNTTVAKKCGQSPLILGSIEREPLQEILERASQSQLIQAIHLFGPSFLAENLDDQSKTKLKGEYVKGDICSLCADMMSNPDLAAAVADIAVSSKTTRLIAVAKALQDHTVP